MRAVILALLAACYSPSPPSGAPCGPGDSCPEGLTCSNGFCGGGDDAGSDAIIIDAACGTCSADGTQFIPCVGAAIDCPLGCSSTGGDHCSRIIPSNEIDPSGTSMTDDIVISADTTVDTDTGAWSGGFTRPATIGGGVMAGIRFTHVTSTQGAKIGVFAVHSITVMANASLRFTGTRAAAMIGENNIVIAGTLDVSAGCSGDRSCAGPGGGTGARMGAPATGGCAGGNGARSATNADDGGGGGGGGGEAGGVGGTATTAAGGTSGGGCLTAMLVPLAGGGGGGAGGPGSSAFPQGGGGGGAVELVSQTAIQITGVVFAGGDGGDGGHTENGSSASAGAGGGGGGGVLLEAPAILVSGTIAANGGGGGGGGNSGVGPGTDGANANDSSVIAAGGPGTAMPGPANGGDGGAAATAPTSGGNGTNGGGGGGARGVIRVNATTKNLSGTISPPATTGVLVTQ